MVRRILITATVQSHIAQFHRPLMELLKENNYEVHIAAKDNLNEKNGLKLDLPDKTFNIPFERNPLSKKNIEAYKKLKKIIIDNNYEIIHCNTPVGGGITRLAAHGAKTQAKVFYTAHGFHFYKGAALKNWLVYYPIEKALAHYTDRLITITKEDYKLANKKFSTGVYHTHGLGANTKKYFVYEQSSIDILRKDLGYTQTQFIILCTGELNKNKNQKIIIEAVSKIVKKAPNVKLLLAGNGEEKEELELLVSSLNLEDYVEFLGYRTDLEKFVNISDLIVSASIREGLPFNIIEGMLCKKPIIASKNRGHNELIDDGVNGFLIESDDVNGFEEYITRFINDFSLRRTIGESAYYNVKKYTDSRVKEELKTIYDL